MIASTMQPSSPENRQVRERILCRTSIYQSISELKMCARRRQTDRQRAIVGDVCVVPGARCDGRSAPASYHITRRRRNFTTSPRCS